MITARHRGGKQTPRAVVMHGTVSSDNAGNARSIAKWWNGPTSPFTSAHYVVDPKETIQCVGDHTVAYHCGHNTGSIAIELCDEEVGPASRWSDKDSTAIIGNAAVLTARLCLAYGIEIRRPSVAELRAKGPHGIYGHNDSRLAFGSTTHSDPLDFPWAKFISLVKAAATAIKAPAKPKPVVKPIVKKPTGADGADTVNVLAIVPGSEAPNDMKAVQAHLNALFWPTPDDFEALKVDGKYGVETARALELARAHFEVVRPLTDPVGRRNVLQKLGLRTVN